MDKLMMLPMVCIEIPQGKRRFVAASVMADRSSNGVTTEAFLNLLRNGKCGATSRALAPFKSALHNLVASSGLNASTPPFTSIIFFSPFI
jgi:hypothetical protein